jgi:DNA polymerase elongation subunit (family B)
MAEVRQSTTRRDEISLPGAYNRYFGRLDTGKMKIRGVMARKGDTPEYVHRMQQELFEVLAEVKVPGAQATLETYS